MGHLKRAKVVLERDQSVIGKQESRLQEAAKKDETDRIKLREEQSNAFREKKQKDVDVSVPGCGCGCGWAPRAPFPHPAHWRPISSSWCSSGFCRRLMLTLLCDLCVHPAASRSDCGSLRCVGGVWRPLLRLLSGGSTTRR